MFKFATIIKQCIKNMGKYFIIYHYIGIKRKPAKKGATNSCFMYNEIDYMVYLNLDVDLSISTLSVR